MVRDPPSNSSFIGQFLWNLKDNIFICSLIITAIEIYDLWKIKFQIFPIFYFSSYGHFCDVITQILDEFSR